MLCTTWRDNHSVFSHIIHLLREYNRCKLHLKWIHRQWKSRRINSRVSVYVSPSSDQTFTGFCSLVFINFFKCTSLLISGYSHCQRTADNLVVYLILFDIHDNGYYNPRFLSFWVLLISYLWQIRFSLEIGSLLGPQEISN